MSKGSLAVISGFSGSGKGTLVRSLLEQYDDYSLSVSATTRDPREGEEEGTHYFFRTKEEFVAMIEGGELLEYAVYVDHYYGTPLAFVEDQLSAGRDVLLEIEIQGALQVKQKHPDAVLLFITPPSIAELVRRLRERGTESEEEIQRRLSRATKEAQGMHEYDYIIVNDRLERAAEQIHQILQSRRCRPEACPDLIEELQRELKEREAEES